MSDQLHNQDLLNSTDLERQDGNLSLNDQGNQDNQTQDDKHHKHHKHSKEHKSKKHKKHKKDKKSKKRKHRDEDDGELDQEKLLKGSNDDDGNLDEEGSVDEESIRALEEEIRRLQQEREHDKQLLQLNPFFEKGNEENDYDSDGNLGYDSDDQIGDSQGNKKSERKRRAKRKLIEQKQKQIQKAKEKQQKEEALKKEEEEKLQRYNEKQREVYLKIKEKNTKPQHRAKADGDDIDLKEDERFSNDAQLLMDRMHTAYISDRDAYEQKKPGLKKLLMAKEVYEALRKISIQERFIELGGCRVLAEWLDMLPDGTFPNFNLVQGLLQCILNLRIENNYLDESGLAPIIQYYETGHSKNPELQKLAKQIIDKWSRQLYNIRSQYDAEGQHDAQYRQYATKLKQHKEKQQLINKYTENSDQENSEEDVKSRKKLAQQENDEKKQITRGRMGIMLPERAAFDFVYRPDTGNDTAKPKKKENESGKSKLQKTLLQLKKSNTRSTSSKGMATVKINY